MCQYCDITNAIEDFDNPFNEHDLNGFINGVWNEEITKRKLPKNIYAKTAEHLNKGVFKGYGKDFITVDYDSPDLLMLEDLTDNIYMFSGAKTYQLTRISEMLKTNKTFYEFQKAVTTEFKAFNDTYLRAEYNTAINSSQAAANWQRIVSNADISPLLQYQTANDGRVRPTHAALDDIIRPIEDKFWSNYYPPNGFNCFEKDTLILTPNGWVEISNIKIGDFVIGGSGEKQLVDFVHINQFEGQMIALISENISISSTENHRYLTLDGWVNAENIEIGDIVVQLDNSIGFNKIICCINNMYVIFRYFQMSFVRKWKTRMMSTFNGYIKRWNKNIKP